MPTWIPLVHAGRPATAGLVMGCPCLRQIAPRLGMLVLIFSISLLFLYLYTSGDAYKMEVVEQMPYTNPEIVDIILGSKRGRVFQQNADDASVVQFKPKTFRFLLNNESLCTAMKAPVFLLWVYSAPKHLELRQALRDTWARPSIIEGFPSVTVFLLGTSEDPKVMAAIQEESHRYGDIVQVDYVETYHRLPYKGITALRWTTGFCQNAAFVVKADDDLFVDMNRVSIILKNIQDKIQTGEFHRKVAVGMVSKGLEVPRNWTGYLEKVNVPKDILPNATYLPTYLHGWTYVLSNNFIPELYQAALRTPIFQIDDVFVTGILTAQISDLTLINVENTNPGDGSGGARFYLAQEAETPTNIKILWCQNLPVQLKPSASDPCKNMSSHMGTRRTFKAGFTYSV